MGSSWKNIFFVTDSEEEEKKVAETKVGDSAPTNQVVTSQIVANNTIPTTVNLAGVPNEKMINSLAKVLNERNIPGPDYYELSITAKSLIEILPDENTRFKAAYTTMQTANKDFSKDIVINSIDRYIEMMEAERKNGLSELAIAKSEKVDKARSSIQTKIENITKMMNQIEEIQKQIESERIEVDAVQKNADNIELELKKQENDFNASVDVIITQLSEDKNKLIKIL